MDWAAGPGTRTSSDTGAFQPDRRFWWKLSRSAPWSQCSTHPLASTFIITPQLLPAQAFAPDIFVSDHFPVVATPTATPKDLCSALLASIWRGARCVLGVLGTPF